MINIVNNKISIFEDFCIKKTMILYMWISSFPVWFLEKIILYPYILAIFEVFYLRMDSFISQYSVLVYQSLYLLYYVSEILL